MFNWVFHYNPYLNLWNAIPRHKYQEYWSNLTADEVLKSKDLNVLIEMINRGEDFIKSIPEEK